MQPGRGGSRRYLGHHGLFPGLTADIAGLVNRVLPAPESVPERSRGAEVDRRIDSQLFRTLTALGRSAARRFNE